MSFETALAENPTAADIVGAWQSTTIQDDGMVSKSVVIFTEHHQVAAWFDPQTGELESTNGGTWSMDGNVVTEIVEFDTRTPDRAGASVSFEITLMGDILGLPKFDWTLERIDVATDKSLAGAWELADPAPEEGEELVRLASGARFQWIRFKESSGEVLAIMGGHYSVEGSNLIETVDFRSQSSGAEQTFRHHFEKDHGLLYLTPASGDDNDDRQTWRRR
jgi:hypothetical protein